MSKPRIIITLEPQERSALMKLARKEKRTDKEQALYILLRELKALGYLAPAKDELAGKETGD